MACHLICDLVPARLQNSITLTSKSQLTRRHLMSRITCFAIGLALVSVGLSRAARAADEKVNVTGTWKFEVDLSGNQGTPTFEFKQEGEKLTGKYKGQFGEADLT